MNQKKYEKPFKKYVFKGKFKKLWVLYTRFSNSWYAPSWNLRSKYPESSTRQQDPAVKPQDDGVYDCLLK